MGAAYPTPEQRKIQSLEGLRGLMAWWVVAGHIGHTIGLNSFLLTHNVLAVYVFVILSGFVISRLIDLKRESYAAYLTRRAFRIFPLYLVVLVVSVALLVMQRDGFAAMTRYSAENLERVRLAQESISQLPAHFIAHALLLQGVVPNSWLPHVAYTIVGQAWSVSLEWQFYVVAPLVLAALHKKLGRLAVVLGCIVLGLAGWRISGAFLGSLLSLFMLGITSYLHLRDRKWLVGMLVSAAAAFVQVGILVALPLAIWALVFGSVLGWPQLRWLGSRQVVYLGERSYSVYMVHMIPIYVSAYLFPDRTAVAVLTIIGTVALSALTYRFIEKPGIELGAAIARRYSTVTARLDTSQAPVG